MSDIALIYTHILSKAHYITYILIYISWTLANVKDIPKQLKRVYFLVLVSRAIVQFCNIIPPPCSPCNKDPTFQFCLERTSVKRINKRKIILPYTLQALFLLRYKHASNKIHFEFHTFWNLSRIACKFSNFFFFDVIRSHIFDNSSNLKKSLARFTAAADTTPNRSLTCPQFGESSGFQACSL